MLFNRIVPVPTIQVRSSTVWSPAASPVMVYAWCRVPRATSPDWKTICAVCSTPSTANVVTPVGFVPVRQS
jgi:hypothetical protein